MDLQLEDAPAAGRAVVIADAPAVGAVSALHNLLDLGDGLEGRRLLLLRGVELDGRVSSRDREGMPRRDREDV